MKQTLNDIRETWKVHKWIQDGRILWYVGPVYGRIMIEYYEEKETAKQVVLMHNWMLEKLKIKPKNM